MSYLQTEGKSCEVCLRPDGIYLLYRDGEEAGPFANTEAAEAFLDYVELVQGAT